MFNLQLMLTLQPTLETIFHLLMPTPHHLTLEPAAVPHLRKLIAMLVKELGSAFRKTRKTAAECFFDSLHQEFLPYLRTQLEKQYIIQLESYYAAPVNYLN